MLSVNTINSRYITNCHLCKQLCNKQKVQFINTTFFHTFQETRKKREDSEG